jgi:hypothetical protein
MKLMRCARPSLRLDRLAPAIAISAIAAATGCLRVATEEVLVRDPHQVSVLRADGTISLPAGDEPAAAVHREGVYRPLFTPVPYRAVVERDAAGSITLRCEGCSDDWWVSRWSPTLVTGEGALFPVTGISSSAVNLGPHEVDLRVRTCLLSPRGKGRCRLDVEAQLATPLENVVEIRRSRSPFRPLGGVLLAFGVFPMFAGATVAAGVLGRRFDTRDRILMAAPLFTLGGAFSASGIWYLTAPAEEQVIHPGGARE